MNRPAAPALVRRFCVLVSLALGMLLAAGAAADAAVSHQLIDGSGSSWASNAVNQWIADVQPQGLSVVYTNSGSAQGRKDFGYQTVDFAVSDIGFQGVDPVTGGVDNSQGRAYAYLPVVAGGTAFPYQVKVAGQLVRNIRLSGLTLAKIFTNQITNWNDPAITADNNGRRLPSLTIIPVVHSEGSGSTAQFTRYLDTEYPSIWRPFQGRAGLTEYFPSKGQMIAQNGSDGVMNFVSSEAANGAIGYDEYSYALAKNYPVVKLLNKAGYFTLPTQYNVAVALTQAQINMNKASPDYLLQNLNSVYVYGDPRAYAMSSYSYMIIPTGKSPPAGTESRMTTAKRQTLADFLYYSICQGQAEMGPIGYSPLPINLVEASFAQTNLLKTADPGVDLTARDVTTCHNPTFVAGQPTRNYLAEIAPQPPSCDKVGAGPCAGNEGSANSNPTSGGKVPGVTTGRTAGSKPTAARLGGATSPGGSGTGPGSQSSAGPVAGGDVNAVPVDLAASQGENPVALLAGFAVLMLLVLLAGPPVLAHRLAARHARPGAERARGPEESGGAS
jgi:phosphate transport system substrate-binding protein